MRDLTRIHLLCALIALTQAAGAAPTPAPAPVPPVVTAPAPVPPPAPAPAPKPPPAQAPAPVPPPAQAPAPVPPPAQAPAPANALLTWVASPSPDVTGYRVYFGTHPGTYQQPRGAGVLVAGKLTVLLNGFTRNTRFYFAVTAVDAAGNESEYSNEVSKEMPK